jgi:hypothetical protein
MAKINACEGWWNTVQMAGAMCSVIKSPRGPWWETLFIPKRAASARGLRLHLERQPAGGAAVLLR